MSFLILCAGTGVRARNKSDPAASAVMGRSLLASRVEKRQRYMVVTALPF